MLTTERIVLLRNLEESIGVDFRNIETLSQALTHSSYINENHLLDQDNERLEFLGDAILKLTITEYLFTNYPEKKEGELSKLLAIWVSDQLLAKKAKELSLGSYMLFGKNEAANDGANIDSNLGDALESIFAAYYLDNGLESAKQAIHSIYQPIFSLQEDLTFLKDYKTILQEYTQTLGFGIPDYSLIETSGPDHNKTFLVEGKVTMEDRIVTKQATAKTKKAAEQATAKLITEELKI